MSESPKPVPCDPRREAPSLFAAALGVLGVTALAAALVAVDRTQFNVVTYASITTGQPRYLPATAFAWTLWLAMPAMAWSVGGRVPIRRRCRIAASLLSPLALTIPVGIYAFADSPPPFALPLLMILPIGWSAFRIGARHGSPGIPERMHALALWSVIVLIVLLTLMHTFLQLNFFEHFMLGHADFGHFTEELKNALAGRGLRSDSFDNTRLGWHFVPLMYALVPGYALWPSPVFVMACGALFVHLVALPAYYLARKVSGSRAVGWLFAVAWLLLPSQSRLVYANTYGFQWIYAAMPLLGLMIVTGLGRRTGWHIATIILVLLCKETAAAVVLGWGVYLAVFTPRRKLGTVIAAGSLAYALLCLTVVIPHFAASGSYERLDLYGDWGRSLGEIGRTVLADPTALLMRLSRREVIYFLLMLIVPMGLLPLCGRRLALAAVPSLLLILPLANEQWLSIKFWHQATILPILFFAGIASLRTKPSGSPWPRLRGLNRSRVQHGMALTALVCAAWAHYLYGFSPVSRSFEPYQNAAFLHRPDPRLDTVRQLRFDIPRERTILATERVAAHFTDYRRVYTGDRGHNADYVVIDRTDSWDTSGLPRRANEFLASPDYRVYRKRGPIIVFERISPARGSDDGL